MGMLCCGEGREVKLITRGGSAAAFGHEGQQGASVGSGVREDETGVGRWP